ncbi:hypothetical protein DUI87_15018 [Hirundo rustica rustica]|uniref:Uncharacterized protein n=1 Tax=Hirundo rustica rustica TaxID=333673 RepID=A0A3M0K6J6_HIRRU|nr:hypothetical protein DUI87_15018 [Hirundo rustica rustica]
MQQPGGADGSLPLLLPLLLLLRAGSRAEPGDATQADRCNSHMPVRGFLPVFQRAPKDAIPRAVCEAVDLLE